ncbi:MAG: ABC transporter ATP-binding protein [Myxococcales bacterium]|nr:ABC transporter ATP-binding protein [Myxococcales bacterium]
MAIVELRQVTKRYGQGAAATLALSEVSLEVRPGESVAVLGPSGSGKSTLLAVAALVEPATAGEVRFMGASVAGMSEAQRAARRLRHAGLAFDSEPLLDVLTVAENVDLLLAAAEVPAAERARRREEALAALEVAHLAGRLPHELSAGQRQRVAIARALAKRPTLMVADEPTAHLDSRAAETVALALCGATLGGCAVLFATHDPKVARCATRQVQLADGRVRS